jgi:hypothetical protein
MDRDPFWVQQCEEQLARIRRKVLDRGIRLDPPLSEGAVADFEAQVGVRLPEDYRRFLLKIGDGPCEEMIGRRLSEDEVQAMGFGAGQVVFEFDIDEYERREGPPHYGLQPLERTAVAYGGHQLRPSRPFPLTADWQWEDEPEPDQALKEAVFNDGHLFLGTQGCGEDWLLVVTGSERGRIWNRADVGAGPCNLNFLDWYERWLDGRPLWDD